jgi:hypothetical protein
MRRVSGNFLLMLFLLIIISGFPTSADRVAAAGIYNRVWIDKFDSAAPKPDWTILNENLSNWSIILTGNNYLRILTEENFLENSQEHEPYNQFMVNVPDGDFRAMTYVAFNPGDSDQFAGMRVRVSTLDYIEIHLTFGSSLKQVDWDINRNGTLTRKSVDYNNSYPAIYLRITRTGNIYTGEIQSTDTPGWSLIGSYTADYPAASIGLVAGNSQAGVTSIPADFDFMRIDYYAPYFIFMPAMRR